MIELDPEEIFAGGFGDVLRRLLSTLACLYIGSFCAFIATLVAEAVDQILTGSFDFAFFFSGWESTLWLLPFWSFGSFFVFLSFPNIFFTSTYFFRCEEPSYRNFMIFATVQQIALAGTLGLHYFSNLGSNIWLYLLGALIFIFCQIGAWLGFFFTTVFFRNRARISHEEHLMGVAAENAAWRQKLEDAEFIPPPPSGPAAPKARELNGNKRTTKPKAKKRDSASD